MGQRKGYTADQLAAIEEFMTDSLLRFERGADGCRRMLEIRHLEQTVNQLAYYKAACSAVRQLISDVQRRRPLEAS